MSHILSQNCFLVCLNFKLIKMKFSKKIHLGLSLLFTIDFIYSLFDERDTHDLFFLDVNIWVYRTYRFAMALLFIALYLKQKDEDSKNQ